jgi:hypothetical protein
MQSALRPILGAVGVAHLDLAQSLSKRVARHRQASPPRVIAPALSWPAKRCKGVLDPSRGARPDRLED